MTPTKRKSKPARRKSPRRNPSRGASAVQLREVESLRAEIERLRSAGGPPRWNADADDVRRSVIKLVLTLVDFIRQIMERQAIRRMEAGTLTQQETEAVGLALMRIEETIRELAAQFDIRPEELKLDLGPLGRLT